MNLYEINYSYNNETMIATPTAVYKVDDDGIRYFIVVIYKITYTASTEVIIAHVPYYLSDGHTNKFRAGMLFPLICFNDTNTVPPVCPMDKNRSTGLMFKYDVITNMNFNGANKWIEDTITKTYPDLKFDHSKEKNQKV